MNGYDQTSIGGPREAFFTTEWSIIEQIKVEGGTAKRELINDLLRKYWKPVYCYLRRKGIDNEQAKDLTQGFFTEVVLGRSLIEKAEQYRGRFRTFLLCALQQYIAEIQRHQQAMKRTPPAGLISLGELDTQVLPEAPAHLSAEESFHYAWASQLLDQLLTETEAQCQRDGKMSHWQVFRAHVLQPILENAPAPSLTKVCRQYGVDNPTRAANMIVTVKRRFQSVLKRTIRRSVLSDEDADSEFTALLQIFSESRAS